MPEQSETPASKRFLPPSGSSVARDGASSSSYRKARLAGLSQTASSSPHPRTPFSRQSLYHDEIETSFDERTEANSPISKTAKVHNNLGSHSIEDALRWRNSDDTSMPNEPVTPVTTPAHVNHPLTALGERDPPHIPPRDLSFPLPKRQKTEHSPVTLNDTIEVSSSSSADEVAFQDSDLDGDLDAHNLNRDAAAAVSIDKIIHEKKDDGDFIQTGFRLPPTADGAPRQQGKRHVSQGIFKNLSTHRDPWLQTPLPSAFSPSKRKSKYDYLRGGMAETVRNWVLDLAGDQGKVDPRDIEIAMKHIASDPSGRFELADDDKCQAWMLVCLKSEPRGSHGFPNHEDRSKGTSQKIVVKDTGTTWDTEGANLTSSCSRGDKLRVATLWHPV